MINQLNRVPLFAGLNDAQISLLNDVSQLVHYEQEDFIIREYEADNALFILMEGEVEISKSLVLPEWMNAVKKQEKALLRVSAQYYPFFGEMAMFDDDPERSANIRALTPCKMIKINKTDLFKVTESDPTIGKVIFKNIISVLVGRLKKANQDILKLTTAFSLALES